MEDTEEETPAATEETETAGEDDEDEE